MLAEASLFEEYNKARHIDEWGDDENDDEMDVDEIQHQNNQVFQLANGGFHVCKGKGCPYVSVSFSGTEREFICRISGQVVAKTIEANTDLGWTGRSVGSSDPDSLNAGCLQNTWKNKKDAFSTSVQAWNKAAFLNIDDVEDEDDNNFRVPVAPRDTKTVKRGALCVVEKVEAQNETTRKDKAIKRANLLFDQNTMDRLRKDASAVISKLLSVPVEDDAPSSSSSSNAQNPTNAPHAPPTPAATDAASLEDPRLQNYDFVFLIGLRRYLAKCKQDGAMPNLDQVHNVAVAASSFSKTRQKAAKKKREHITDKNALRSLVTNGQTVDLCATLVCSLWVAVSNTTPFQEAQFGDSFKPFAAGVLYALENGVVMDDIDGSELELIPRIKIIADHLPTLKTSAGNHGARQLQSASHKGMCAIHRSVASVKELTGNERLNVINGFKHAARVGFKLLERVSTQAAALASKG